LPRTIYELPPQFKVAGFFEALLSRWRNVAFLAQNMPFEAYRMRGGCTRRGAFWVLRGSPLHHPKKETSEMKMKIVLNIGPGHRMCRFITKYNNWRKEILGI
jgi:hypothetical protein